MDTRTKCAQKSTPTDSARLHPWRCGAATELSEEAFIKPIPTVTTVSAAAPQPALTVHTTHCASVELDVLFRTMYSMLLVGVTVNGAAGRSLPVAEEDDEDEITAAYVTLDRAGVAVPARRTSTAGTLEAESPSTHTGSPRASGPVRSALRRDVSARRSGALARSPAEAPSTARTVRTMAAQTTHLLQLLRTLLTPSAAESAQARPESLALFFLAFLGRLSTFTGDWTGVLVAVRGAGQTRLVSMLSLRCAESPDLAANCVEFRRTTRCWTCFFLRRCTFGRSRRACLPSARRCCVRTYWCSPRGSLGKRTACKFRRSKRWPASSANTRAMSTSWPRCAPLAPARWVWLDGVEN